MTPLGRIALGLLVVLLDLRLEGFDALPDVLGWVLVVVGLGELLPVCVRLAPARSAAVVAGGLSLADLVHPTRTTTTGDPAFPNTTTAVVPPEGLQGLLSLGAMVAGLVVVVLLSLRLRDLAAAAGDGRRERSFGRFAVYHGVVGGLAVLVALASVVMSSSGTTDVQGPAAAVLVVVVLAALLVEAAFLLALRGARHEPWTLPRGVDVPEHDPTG
jgi:hypothetical protein